VALVPAPPIQNLLAVLVGVLMMKLFEATSYVACQACSYMMTNCSYMPAPPTAPYWMQSHQQCQSRWSLNFVLNPPLFLCAPPPPLSLHGVRATRQTTKLRQAAKVVMLLNSQSRVHVQTSCTHRDGGGGGGTVVSIPITLLP